MPSQSPYTPIVSNPPGTRIVGREVRTFDEIDSTNTYVLEHGFEGLAVVADRQTMGRGRLGRTWFSAPGLGLWCTVALEGDARGLVFAAALAVRDAIAPRCALTIKWPNDLLLDKRKVCGILIEQRGERIALGIGLNVHHKAEDFPEELRAKAGSLEMLAGGEWDRAELLRGILTHLDQWVILLRWGGHDAVRREWAQACNLVGRRIRCGESEGVVAGIDDIGALEVDSPGGRIRVVSGDLTVLDGD